MKSKKFISSLFIVAVIVSLFSMGVFALGNNNAATLSITPNVTEASPGEKVNFTFKLSKVTNLAGLVFTVNIPEGLTYKSYTLGVDTSSLGRDSGISFTEGGKKFVLVSPNTGYTSSSETKLMTITCSVDNNASGKLALTTSDLDCCDLDIEDISTTVVPSGVIVGVQSSESPGEEAVSNKSIAEATGFFGDKEVRIILQDPNRVLEEGYTIEMERTVEDLGEEYDSIYGLEKAYKASVTLKDKNGQKISGDLGGNVRLLIEIPDDSWDYWETQVLRINPGDDTEHVESIEYRLYDASGKFIKVVEKDYKPEEGQKVRMFISIWTNHFSESALDDKTKDIKSDENDSDGFIEKKGQDLRGVYFVAVVLILVCIVIYFLLRRIRKSKHKV